jgi:hypothetical protein
MIGHLLNHEPILLMDKEFKARVLAEKMFGDYSRNRYMWIFENIRPIKEPFPVKGSQGFFEVEVPEGCLK